MRIVMDIETDGLLENVTKIHCLSYLNIDTDDKIVTLVDYNEMKKLLLQDNLEICGHNIVRYDVPALEKLLSIKITARLIDTLALSWYLYPMKTKHGLEYWGDELSVKKPIILDWTDLKIEDYIHRCENDVEINSLLFLKQLNYLTLLYDANITQINNLINYLVFKLDCAREQEELGCKVDRQLVLTSLQELQALKEEKISALIEAMPKQIKYKEVKKPSKTHKIDGSISSAGEKWYSLLLEYNLPEDYDEIIMVKVSEEPGNPSSTIQLKDWLFSLGWTPRVFEYRKNTKDEVNEVPQIYVNDEVCDSIKDLYEIEPALENLDMLSLINHRIGIFESFLKSMNSNDFTKAEVAGLTPTFRFKHRKPCVNLPKKSKFYGEQIRGSIIRPSENHLLCGSDMSSLEDSTKQHYMYFFDPEYVIQMRVPGFDPHLDIAVLAGMLTPEQVEQHKTKQVDYSEIRNLGKVVNFSSVYGAGPPKIAQSTGMPLQQAQKLHQIYWERNKAVKQVANACQVKTTKVEGEVQMWIFNPISKFWCLLRYEKDKFSVLNQSSGVYCFDLFVKYVRQQGIKIQMQMHDEILFPFLIEEQQLITDKLNFAINKVNEIVKLNVPLGISIEIGTNYVNVH